MNLELPNELRGLDMSLTSILFGLYIIAIGVAYYFIYRKHHKRNKIKLDELITLVSKFYVTTIITTIAIVLGIVCIIGANAVKYDKTEMIFSIFFKTSAICAFNCGKRGFATPCISNSLSTR